MSKDKLIIGIDLDGVCGDFYGIMRKFYSEYSETPLNCLPEASSFDLNEWGIFERQQYEDFHRFAVTQKNLFREMPMINGARKYIKKLSDEGFRIRIVTHRLCIKYFHKEATSQTVEWLEKNGIPFWDLCFLKDKTAIKSDVFVEDNPYNISKLRENGTYTICFANGTNEKVTEPRAYTWGQVYNIIQDKINDL